MRIPAFLLTLLIATAGLTATEWQPPIIDANGRVKVMPATDQLRVRSTDGIKTEQAATQDGIRLLGRAGGTSSYVATLTPTTLTASRTYTMPDATTTIAGLAVAQTFSLDQTFGASVVINGVAGSERNFQINTSGSRRWRIIGGSTAESGANAGTELNFVRYDDAGSFLGTWLSVTRSTGVAAFSGGITLSGNYSQSGSGTTSTGTGAVSLNGAVTAISTIAQTVTLSGAGTVTGTNVALTFQNTGGTNRAIISVGTSNPSGASTAATTGIEGRADLSASATVTPSGDFTGVNGQARFNSGASVGTVGAAYGVQGSINNSNASTTITSAYAFFAPAPTRTGALTTYAAYGTAALNSGEYAFRSLGTGLVSIGDTTASTSTTTGSLVNGGGFGNAGTIYSGGRIFGASGLQLDRANSSAFAESRFTTGGTTNWSFGLRSGDSDFHVTDTAIATDALTVAQGTGGTITTASGRSVRIGTAALATTATAGFLYVPTCAGTPTGVPTTLTGTAPIAIDSTNNKLYFYSGGAWRAAGP